MDGDLQHPPELIPQLLEKLKSADVVVASRYTQAKEVESFSALRRMASLGTTYLAKAVFPRSLKGCSDPMSGFFAIRKDAVDFATLKPQGFKILMELLVRRKVRIAEVPFTFGTRFAGESKAGLKEGLRFLHQLASLRLRDRRVAFSVVGALGVLPNLLMILLLTTVGVPYLPAAIVAVQLAIGWNFTGAELFVWHDRRLGRMWHRAGKFWAVGNLDLVRLPAVVFLVEFAHTNVLLATVVTFLAFFVLRFTLTHTLVYRDRPVLEGVSV
jgi:dolichol-phosphate mannosyltransferase